MSLSPRYRFGEFVLSPRRRLLLRNGSELPLIPRYFDLLLYLVQHRQDAVHRRDIFDAVWGDVAVSDSALSQAVRTIRRALDDDPREPTFVRTVSRHGYQFVFAAVVEEADAADLEAAPAITTAAAVQPAAGPPDVSPSPERASDAFEPLLQRLRVRAARDADLEDQRDAAERLHEMGTAEALRRLGTGPDTGFARALLRDTRWDIPLAGPVPIVGQRGALSVVAELFRLRLHRAAGIVAARWWHAALATGLAGAVGGAIGGALLVAAPGSAARAIVIPVLALIGLGCGAVSGAGVAAGLSVADAAMRSRRLLASTLGGALGGFVVGLAIELLGRWTLEVLVGVSQSIGGGTEGLAIGAAAGFGYGLTTRAESGMPAPHGARRLQVASATAVACAIAALALSLAGHVLVGGTLHAIAQASLGAEAVLTPLGRLIGEPGFGPVTAALIAMGEGATFGAGLALGLTSRPKIR